MREVQTTRYLKMNAMYKNKMHDIAMFKPHTMYIKACKSFLTYNVKCTLNPTLGGFTQGSSLVEGPTEAEIKIPEYTG